MWCAILKTMNRKATGLFNCFIYRLNKAVPSVKQTSCLLYASLLISVQDSERLPHPYYQQKVQKCTYTASVTITASSRDWMQHPSPVIMQESVCMHAQPIRSWHSGHMTRHVISNNGDKWSGSVCFRRNIPLV